MSRNYEVEVDVEMDISNGDLETLLEKWGMDIRVGTLPGRLWVEGYEHAFQGEIALAGGKDEAMAHAELRAMLNQPLVGHGPVEKLATRWRCVDFDEWDDEIEEDYEGAD